MTGPRNLHIEAMDKQTKYRIWEGKEFTCNTCGKKSTLGFEMKEIFEAEKLSQKVTCIDCIMKSPAEMCGISPNDLLKKEEETQRTYNLYMDTMIEKYFKENEKEKFDSAQEEINVKEFFDRCWRHYPKWFLFVPALYGKEKTKEHIKAISFNFRELASMIKASFGGTIDRNAPCPCRSGKKYKKCYGK